MALPKVEERTLYTPIINLLRNYGYEAIGNTIVSGKEPDIIFKYGSLQFVIEVKVGKKDSIGLSAVAQAYDYGRRLNTQNVIILIYPDEIRNSAIENFNALDRIATESEIWAVILTEYWTESRSVTFDFLARQLKLTIDKQISRVDFGSAVKLIGEYASDLNSVIFQIKTDELVAEVVNKLDLFASVGEIKEKETAKSQVVSLASFLLFNQLLFYHIYTKKAGNDQLPEMGEIKSIKDIEKYFNQITKIDYRSIYRTNILTHIPVKDAVIGVINDVIKAIKLLRAEYISHDLAGRFFHDLIPFEVRKILAAFYTHPNSADLLTGLAIDTWDSTVIDPACGSGTLLVSSYKTKMRLYEKSKGLKDPKAIHKSFLENDISGIDLMPFAAHISTINLAMQNIEQPTNLVKIASMDSLGLAKDLKSKDFVSGKGYKISGFEHTIQSRLDGDVSVIRKHGAVSMEGKGSGFKLTPVDLVIMNPPFSDREKMPGEMREKINENEVLNKISGNRVNLWGSFMALSDLLLKKDGKLAAVIPINLARGEATKKIREFMLKNYSTQYIIKPLEDEAFSEGASFKDILFIARKGKPIPTDYTAIVSIKTSVKSLPSDAIKGIISRLRESYEKRIEVNSDTMEVEFIKTSKLHEYSNNLMPLIGLSSSKSKKNINNFLSAVRQKGREKLKKIRDEMISEGYHVSPAGLSELVFITRPTDESRIERAFLTLTNEIGNSIQFKIKGLDGEYNVPRTNVKHALRTLTSVKKFDVGNLDYILIDPPDNFEKIKQFSKWEGDFNWSNHRENVRKKTSEVFVGRRFRPNSRNTHHFAFYSQDGAVAPDTFKIVKFSGEIENKIQTLILNSCITMANIVSLREQTTGGFTDIRESELTNFDIFDLSHLSELEKLQLIRVFDSIKDVDFPSIIEQYVSTFKGRLSLDLSVMKILGFKEDEAKDLLYPLYETIIDELRVKG